MHSFIVLVKVVEALLGVLMANLGVDPGAGPRGDPQVYRLWVEGAGPCF